MIDADGFRANVGIILSNQQGDLLWARRIGQDAWQFPQGGLKKNETALQAMYRELEEEVGLKPADVCVCGCTRGWLRYRLPRRYIRYNSRPLCIGQKQVWFMLRLLGPETSVRLDLTAHPEFDLWRWVDYWHPLREVVSFKRRVYECALKELAPLIPDVKVPSAPGSRARRRPRRSPQRRA